MNTRIVVCLTYRHFMQTHFSSTDLKCIMTITINRYFQNFSLGMCLNVLYFHILFSKTTCQNLMKIGYSSYPRMATYHIETCLDDKLSNGDAQNLHI